MATITSKKVSVYPNATNMVIKKTSVPIFGTTLNIVLSLNDIKICLDYGADVDEVLGKNNLIRLNDNNYDKDNSNGSTSTAVNSNYSIESIQIVNDLPVEPYKNILYVVRDTKIGYTWDAVNRAWIIIFNHVSDTILDGVVDNNPVTGESVKKYMIKKLSEMSGINVLGKADKVDAVNVDKVLLSDDKGNLKASTYKVGGDVMIETTDNLLASEKAVKSALSWESIG